MTLRDDNSLGFYMQTPEEGIDLYGGVGKFYNDIEMSSSGLRGFGSFDYLTSTTWSDQFMMHPDSMMARSRSYLIRERLEATEFPQVENTEADITLIAAQEVMKVEAGGQDLSHVQGLHFSWRRPGVETYWPEWVRCVGHEECQV